MSAIGDQKLEDDIYGFLRNGLKPHRVMKTSRAPEKLPDGTTLRLSMGEAMLDVYAANQRHILTRKSIVVTEAVAPERGSLFTFKTRPVLRISTQRVIPCRVTVSDRILTDEIQQLYVKQYLVRERVEVSRLATHENAVSQLRLEMQQNDEKLVKVQMQETQRLAMVRACLAPADGSCLSDTLTQIGRGQAAAALDRKGRMLRSHMRGCVSRDLELSLKLDAAVKERDLYLRRLVALPSSPLSVLA